MQRGFSLVELSIVLVILGLLTGGILAGQSLIKAAQLRATTAEYSRYLAAVQSFRGKYFAMPGDFTAATQFWGRMNGNADCVTNSGTAVNATTGVCDGDGDGSLAAAGAAGASGEIFQFWRHLAQAGLIEGNYSGLAGSGAVNDHTIGVNCPASKFPSGGWQAASDNIPVGNPSGFAGDYGNGFTYGAHIATALRAPLLKPEEAWNIDTKLDDGKPYGGKIYGRAWATSGSVCAIAASNTDRAATYNLADSSVLCALHFTYQF